jgi:hypothetical protein
MVIASTHPGDIAMPVDPKSSKSPVSSTSKTPESRVRLDTPDAAQDPHGATPAPPGARAKMPHERDETVGMTGGVPSGKMQQAHRDVTRGVQDTDRGPEADRAYQKQKR